MEALAAMSCLGATRIEAGGLIREPKGAERVKNIKFKPIYQREWTQKPSRNPKKHIFSDESFENKLALYREKLHKKTLEWESFNTASSKLVRLNFVLDDLESKHLEDVTQAINNWSVRVDESNTLKSPTVSQHTSSLNVTGSFIQKRESRMTEPKHLPSFRTSHRVHNPLHSPKIKVGNSVHLSSLQLRGQQGAWKQTNQGKPKGEQPTTKPVRTSMKMQMSNKCHSSLLAEIEQIMTAEVLSVSEKVKRLVDVKIRMNSELVTSKQVLTLIRDSMKELYSSIFNPK